MSFIHLHNHTHYSVLDGAITVPKLVKRALDNKMNAVAISDHGNMCGAIEFYQKATKEGIKPIIAQEFYIAPDSRFNRSYKRGDETNYHLMVYAADNRGYENLLRLSSIGYLEGFYYKPRIDFEVLTKYNEGLLCSSACIGGEVPSLILTKRADEARKAAERFQQLFGDRYYLEIQDHGIPEQKIANDGIALIADQLGIPLIATNDCHYTDRDDAWAHEVLLCIQTGKTMSDESRMRFGSDQFYFKTEAEMERLFAGYPDAIFNTQKLADRCNVELVLNRPVLPTFEVPQGHTLDSYMREIVFEGAPKRYGAPIPERVEKQIEYELSVIQKMGFAGYFLIVWDFINHARSRGIPVGPGRGSAAGSIVSYCMGITQLDPLAYNLLFERFLNPDRNEMPDMDIDFCGDRREEVIEYVRKKYGEDHVSQIMAFNTLKPKAAIKDVARALDIPYTESNAITKFINEKTIADSLKDSDEFSEFYKSSELARKVVDTATKLEGLVRSFGKHAAGVVISKEVMTHYVPLYRDAKDGSISSQFEKYNSEAAGLVKMDFLGLKNLTIIDNALKLIKAIHGTDIEIDRLALDDRKVYKLLQNADTNGIFQLESQGMKSLLRKLGPTLFDDIIAVGALYRPGPLNSGMVDQFIRCKKDSAEIKYPHPSLEPVLSDTLGVIVYQEQVMKISQVMGGFSLSEADKLRKAMGKKNAEIIQNLRGKFLEGAKKQKIDASIAESVYDAMAKFAEYGFNKSHAAAYGLVTYQTAWLKAHYRAEYMCALLTASRDNQDDVTRYIADCRSHNITVMRPDINHSCFSFTIESKKIRFGFSAIKGVGEKAIEAIIGAREKLGGSFKTLEEFLENVEIGTVNKGVLEALIKSGSMTSLVDNRAKLFANLDLIIDCARQIQKEKRSGQMGLFGGAEEASCALPLIDTPKWPDNIKLNFEKEVLGLYVSGHPLAKYEREIREYSSCSIINLDSAIEEADNKERLWSIVGILEGVRKHVTQKGKPMAFAQLEDMESQIEVIIFPKSYEKFEHMLSLREPLMLTGKIEVEEEDASESRSKKMFVDSIVTLTQARHSSIAELHISLDQPAMIEETLDNIRVLIEKHNGRCPVFFHVPSYSGEVAIVKAHPCFCVDPSEELIGKLRTAVGSESIRYTFKNAS